MQLLHSWSAPLFLHRQKFGFLMTQLIYKKVMKVQIRKFSQNRGIPKKYGDMKCMFGDMKCMFVASYACVAYFFSSFPEYPVLWHMVGGAACVSHLAERISHALCSFSTTEISRLNAQVCSALGKMAKSGGKTCTCAIQCVKYHFNHTFYNLQKSEFHVFLFLFFF